MGYKRARERKCEEDKERKKKESLWRKREREKINKERSRRGVVKRGRAYKLRLVNYN